ncbi:isoprenylcysteine carboxylmethyltransferase family protein [Schumannella sp. 10F1B-5-1]|uniref:methyltransferase family protein n=1 Tax=Schumannella sp. 10F1B-5-1 TaxID=2590780 RepID=UPI001131D040|nr:isoprenylcysteine carboxylmethyltransferase family protein [Schumannella sp. 10F1B-5-1]TPW71667.1 isoprenylcysteine carboxylmethyltransferase family protein [Schumannella sp. 10F1B-5-1]
MGWGRAYFAVQAVAGAAWWVAVFTIPLVRELTLGSLDARLVAAADIPLFVVASALAATLPIRAARPAAIVATAWTALVAIAMALFATVTTEAGWGVLIMAAATGCSALALALLLWGRIPTRWIVAGPFAFRPARATATTRMLGALISAQIAVFWGLFLVVGPLVIRALERRWRLALELSASAALAITVVGAIVFVLAAALGLWSSASMAIVGRGTPLPSAMANHLVVAGPYRLVRNPMAVAGIVQGAAVGLVLGSWLVVAYAVVGSVIWNYAVRPHEEADLERRFGDEFRAYRDRVRCWVPRIPARTVSTT